LVNKKYNSENYYYLEILNFLKKHRQDLREENKKFFRNKIMFINSIIKNIKLNKELSQNQIEYIENLKKVYI